MEPVGPLTDVDAFHFIGVQVLVKLVTGEKIKGELYSIDLHRCDIVIIRGEDDKGCESLYLVSAPAVVCFEPLGPPNQTMEDIPRIPYDDLVGAKTAVESADEDMLRIMAQEDPHTRITYHKRWTTRNRTPNVPVCSSDETNSLGQSGHWNTN
ncbi:uncharacterized protein BXIN_1853 [Babesia sp. Xinjiang]|uniref:uncharacterized protein n=1 Tax=Babesia sp. Xinjiang TaxID=462227 RepID=UPI000A229E28|nr:uncharacterized protein BXIN_1853 [Babesia sp. Xinjiang]ORM40433.1 hypothetical protein BXIN_1853 [Babesia sp. Xinjiang]